MYLKIRLTRRYTSPAFLSETHPLLGASPDGVINDNKIVEAVRKEGCIEGMRVT